MNILALDLGTRTGWALDLTGIIESGVQTFDVRRGESPGMRYVRFNAWLEELHGQIRQLRQTLTLVAYEQNFRRGGAATEVAAGFATRVQEFCARHGVDHVAINVATLKKWTTGAHNADKQFMLAAVAARWQEVADDNQADALALLHYSRAHYGGKDH